jgi:GT2 family glycosyltransferase
MVLNWNGAAHLAECLPSVVAAAATAGADVWVVDNASTDGSGALCRERFPSVRFEQIGENLSLAAYNVAAERATADVIVSLDNDVVVEPGFLQPLLRHFDDGEVFAVSPSIRTFPVGSATEHLEATAVAWDRGVLRRGVARTEPGPLFYNCGCAVARDRRKLLELDGFDLLYFPLYHEDVDLSWRAWKRGWQCLYEPESVVYHESGGALGRSGRVTALMTRNELLFHWKNLTSHRLLVSHLLTLVPRLATQARRRDAARLRGFAEALPHLPAALRARRRARAQAMLDDTQAIARVNAP